jgi:HD-GYP domain-containing protein (c-di-GMP phosphodiesterase class II)
MADIFGSFILIENNGPLLDSVLGDKKMMEQFPVLHHRKLTTALAILKSRKDIRAFIISSAASESRGVEEIQKVREILPDIPIIYLDHHPGVLPKIDFALFTQLHILTKPTSFQVIADELKRVFKKDDRWDSNTPGPEAKDVELDLKDKDYVPLRLEDFILTDKSFFNVFIKLGAARFVKILNVGDPIDREFLSTYQTKGVAHLYLPEAEQKNYIALAQRVTHKVVSNSEINSTQKIKQVLGLGASISRSLSHSGISADNLDYASSFMNQSITLIKSMRFKNDSVTDFLRSLENNEHSTTISFLSGILANELGFESSKSIKLVGIAALVHDIGLNDLAPHLMDDHEALSDQKNQIIFDTHAKHGANLLRASGNFEESLCIAVEQHHLRRRGTGHEVRTNNINIVTEIIGVSDDFYNYVIKSGVDKDKMQVFLNTHLKNFSPQVEKAFMKMLTKKKKTAA